MKDLLVVPHNFFISFSFSFFLLSSDMALKILLEACLYHILEHAIVPRPLWANSSQNHIVLMDNFM